MKKGFTDLFMGLVLEVIIILVIGLFKVILTPFM